MLLLNSVENTTDNDNQVSLLWSFLCAYLYTYVYEAILSKGFFPLTDVGTNIFKI